MAERTVSAGLTRGLFEYAVAHGAEPTTLADASGVDPTRLQDNDLRVPFGRYVALTRAAKAMCGDPALPLHYAEASDMAAFSIVGLLANASETMMEALTQLNRYGRLVVEVDTGATRRFEIGAWNGGMWLVDTRPDPEAFPELTESTFTRMVSGPRRFLDRPFVLEAHFTHPEPAHRAAYDPIFRCPLVFGSRWNALRIDPAVTAERVALQPRFVFGVLSAHADGLLKSLETSRTVRGRAESLLMPILHTGDTGVERIARRMGMSRQTLFRRLRCEGVTFSEVLDDLRRRLALGYLEDGKVSVNETAYLVGFSEPAAFSRAFKRWTGLSPRAFSAAARAKAAPDTP